MRTAMQGLLSVHRIQPRPNQPRRRFDDGALEALARSVRSQGILEPLVVRPRGDDYQIVCGERRFKVALSLGLEHVPVRALDLSDAQAFVAALHENLHRDGLSPTDEARAYRQMLDDGLARTQQQVADLLGVSQSRVSRMLALLNLPDELMPGDDAVLTERHVRAMRKLEPAARLNVARRVRTKRLSVRETEALCRPASDSRSDSWTRFDGVRFRGDEQGLVIEVDAGGRLEQIERLGRVIAALSSDVAGVCPGHKN